MIIEPLADITKSQSLDMITKQHNMLDVKSHNNVDFYSMIHSVNSDVKAADTAMTDYMLGKNISTHELMITFEEAKHSLKLAVEVRNKLTEAYQKITRIRV